MLFDFCERGWRRGWSFSWAEEDEVINRQENRIGRVAKKNYLGK